MNRATLLVTTTAAFLLGAVAVNTAPAYADWPVIDVAAIAQEVKSVAAETGILDVLNAMSTVQNTISNTMSAINKAIGPTTYGDTNTLLQEGFTQNANYAKAQIGAQQQITDASNEAMAQFGLQVRDAQIRDEQTASPTACLALDGGVSTSAAAVQAYQVGQVIAAIHDMRGEALPGMPSYYGAGQGVASVAKEHLALYCDQNDVAAGLCATANTNTQDADQHFSSLFGSGTYADQNAVNTAKDYAINLIEPAAPAALRGDQLNSTIGQDSAVRRRSFNARMSLAQSVVDSYIGMQTPSVPLTAQQQQYLVGRGLPQQQTGSMLQVLQIEAERRYSDVSWAAYLQSMPPAAVEREVATELALSTYLEFQILKQAMEHTTVSAALLAAKAEHDFMPTSQMPVPSLANN
jgi:hypothetical protein